MSSPSDQPSPSADWPYTSGYQPTETASSVAPSFGVSPAVATQPPAVAQPAPEVLLSGGQITMLLDRIFGPSPDPATVPPHDSMQRFVRRVLGKNATNPLAGGLLGGFIAAVFMLVLGFAYSIVDLTLAQGKLTIPPFDQFSQTFGAVLQLLAQFERITLIQTTSGGSIGGSEILRMLTPLTLWMLIPAFGALLSGTLAAATDTAHRLRFALTRALLGGLFFGLLMWVLMVTMGNMTIVEQNTKTTIITTISGGSAFLVSLTWGLVCGALGAFAHLFGWHWRKGLVALAQAKPRSLVTSSALSGGLAVVFGVLLCLPVVAGSVGMQVALAGISDPVTTQKITPYVQDAIPYAKQETSLVAVTPYIDDSRLLWLTMPTDQQSADQATRQYTSPTLTVLANGLSGGINLFAWSAGSRFENTTQTVYQQNAYLSSVSSTRSNALPTVTGMGGFDVLWFLLPIVIFFYAGQMAARLRQATDLPQKALVGALSGVAGAIFLAILARLAQSVQASQDSSGNGSLNTVGTNPYSVLLWGLIFGVIFASIGAAQYTPSAKPAKKQPARPWMWSAIVSGALLLGGLVATVQVLGTSGVQSAIDTNTFQSSLLNSHFGLVLILQLVLAVPLLCLAVALIRDLVALPGGSEKLLLRLAGHQQGAAMSAATLSAEDLALPTSLRRHGMNLIVAVLAIGVLGGLLYFDSQLPRFLDQLVQMYNTVTPVG